MQDKEKTVDIDTSGPEVEVELPTQENEKTSGEDKSHENERETKLEDGGSTDDTTKKPSEQSDVPVQEDKREESKKELDDYSDGVKRRIAKLTKKMREAERREEAATLYAKSVLEEQEKLKTRLSKVDTNFVSEMEGDTC
jgi:flagellum-specific peptidoglycan hydrolase FlgJ